MIRKRIVNAYLSSVISISLVLLLTGIAALLIVNAGTVSRYLKENMQISVLLQDDVTDGEAVTLAEELAAQPYVRSARAVSREEGAQELKEMLGDDFLDVFETSPVPVSVDVTLKAEYVQKDSLALVTKALEAFPRVEEVETQASLVEALTGGFEPDGLDSVAPRAAESRRASSLSVPGRSFQPEPVLNSNPT